MPSTDPKALIERRNFWRGVGFLALYWVTYTFITQWSHGSFAEAVRSSVQLAILLVLGGGMSSFVEMRLRGRERWWGRIAEIGAALGALLLFIVWGADWSAWVMAGTFWLGVCGLMVIWMLVRVDLPN